MPEKWVILHKETDLSEVKSLLKGPILTQPHLVMCVTVSRLLLQPAVKLLLEPNVSYQSTPLSAYTPTPQGHILR